jgi:hypothetical protein
MVSTTNNNRGKSKERKPHSNHFGKIAKDVALNTVSFSSEILRRAAIGSLLDIATAVHFLRGFSEGVATKPDRSIRGVSQQLQERVLTGIYYGLEDLDKFRQDPIVAKNIKIQRQFNLVAASIAVAYFMAGKLISIPQDPYLDLPLNQNLDPKIERSVRPKNINPTVADISNFKNIDNALVLCADSEQFNLVVSDLNRRIASRRLTEIRLTPIVEKNNNKDGQYVPPISEKVLSVEAAGVTYFVVNAETCRLKDLKHFYNQLDKDFTIRFLAIRGHNFHMAPALEELRNRDILAKNCLIFMGGCKEADNINEHSSPMQPVIASRDTGYTDSNSTIMFATVNALNSITIEEGNVLHINVSSWLNLKETVVGQNPRSAIHFVFPGTDEYRRVHR